mmetsp:Transcript_18036/g.37847  ORF Transcript_18036/g.37847 Transcript_18036/m.37847 type:complete len:351 (-) Transcript_18036:476-1528(-)
MVFAVVVAVVVVVAVTVDASAVVIVVFRAVPKPTGGLLSQESIGDDLLVSAADEESFFFPPTAARTTENLSTIFFSSLVGETSAAVAVAVAVPTLLLLLALLALPAPALSNSTAILSRKYLALEGSNGADSTPAILRIRFNSQSTFLLPLIAFLVVVVVLLAGSLSLSFSLSFSCSLNPRQLDIEQETFVGNVHSVFHDPTDPLLRTKSNRHGSRRGSIVVQAFHVGQRRRDDDAADPTDPHSPNALVETRNGAWLLLLLLPATTATHDKNKGHAIVVGRGVDGVPVGSFEHPLNVHAFSFCRHVAIAIAIAIACFCSLPQIPVGDTRIQLDHRRTIGRIDKIPRIRRRR